MILIALLMLRAVERKHFMLRFRSLKSSKCMYIEKVLIFKFKGCFHHITQSVDFKAKCNLLKSFETDGQKNNMSSKSCQFLHFFKIMKACFKT